MQLILILKPPVILFRNNEVCNCLFAAMCNSKCALWLVYKHVKHTHIKHTLIVPPHHICNKNYQHFIIVHCRTIVLLLILTSLSVAFRRRECEWICVAVHWQASGCTPSPPEIPPRPETLARRRRSAASESLFQARRGVIGPANTLRHCNRIAGSNYSAAGFRAARVSLRRL